jgi:VanZ family protein
MACSTGIRRACGIVASPDIKSHPMRTLLFTLFFEPSLQKQRYRCAIALYLVILALGSVPGARHDIGEFAPGVLLHSAAYAGLTLLLFGGSDGTRFQRSIKSVATIAAMGALDELVQSFLPYRHGAVSDWLVDCSAAIVTALVLWALWPKLLRAPQS